MAYKRESKKIRIVIVDDETPARQRLEELLEGRNNIEIVDSCSNGKEATDSLITNLPDLVFLDIQLQDMTGFEVLEKVGLERIPPVIFITAYDDYALQAFDLHALDYILKPFSDERFEEALSIGLDRVLKSNVDGFTDRLSRLISEYNEMRTPDSDVGADPISYPKRLLVKTARKLFFIPTNEIDWIGSDGGYASIHVGSKIHLIRRTLSNLETILDPTDFVRINRSTIVNINRVAEIHSHFHGDFVVILNSGKRLKLSRTFRVNAERLLGGKL